MENEYKKELYDFAYYLDKMPSSKEKGKISQIFTKFVECNNERIIYKKLIEKSIKNETEIKTY